MKFFLSLCFLVVTNLLSAQIPVGTQTDEQPIPLDNPSFEVFPRLSFTPSGWYDCGFPGESEVDVHPVPESEFQVDKTAHAGNAYMGMVVRKNDTYEAVGQRLKRPLQGGKCYEFTMHLARSATYLSAQSGSNPLTPQQKVNFATPAKLRIWGGNGYCAKQELLAESSLIINTRWLEFNFRFEPASNYSYIVFEAYYKTPTMFPYNGNILLDNLQPIIPVPCEIEDVPEPEPADKPIAVNEPTKKPAVQDPFAPPVVEETKPKETQTNLGGKEKRDLKINQTILVKNLQFDADSTKIPPRSYEAMAELLDFLTENDDLTIEVGGHTNGQPAKAYCDYISTERAKSVVNFLVQRGIDPKRLTHKGYGKEKPIATNATLAGRRKNQRVEIKILGFDR